MKSRSLFSIVLLVAAAACRKEPMVPSTSTTSTQATKTAVTTTAPKAQDLSTAKVNQVIPIPPRVVPRCAAGSVLGADGSASPKADFAKKDKIYFSMWLNEAPAGLQVHVKVFDEKDQPVTAVPLPAEGLKLATVEVPRPAKPGKYRLEGYWGGNWVCEQYIDVKK